MEESESDSECGVNGEGRGSEDASAAARLGCRHRRLGTKRYGGGGGQGRCSMGATQKGIAGRSERNNLGGRQGSNKVEYLEVRSCPRAPNWFVRGRGMSEGTRE